MKTCPKCRLELSCVEFCKSKVTKSGLMSWCKVCTRNKQKESRTKDPIAYRFACSKHTAKSRGLDWGFTKKEYRQLVNKPCYYCNSDTSNIKGGVGLDRVDNKLGYISGDCNTTRGDRFTVEETKIMISALLNFRTNRSII